MGGCSSSEKEAEVTCGSSVDDKNKNNFQGRHLEGAQINEPGCPDTEDENPPHESPPSKKEDLVESSEASDGPKMTGSNPGRSSGDDADGDGGGGGGGDGGGGGGGGGDGGVATSGDEKPNIAESTKTIVAANSKPEVDEVIDIDLEDPDVKKAASLIQSGFKGRMARKKMAARAGDPPIQVERKTELANEEEEEEEKDMKKDMKKEKKKEMKEKDQEDERPISVEPKPDDDGQENVSRAATKIQAGVRGMQVRQNLNLLKRDQPEAEGDNEEEEEEEEEDENENLEKKKEEEAATKIQSGVKGMIVRRQIKQRKEEQMERTGDSPRGGDGDEAGNGDVDDDDDGGEGENDDEVGDDDDDDDDDDKESKKFTAASKIQAGYKGMKSREKVKSMKEKMAAATSDEAYDETKREKNADDDLLNKSATKIQAGLRGMKVRREFRDRQRTRRHSLGPTPIWNGQEEIDRAATKIQAGVRGMKVRNELKKQQSEIDHRRRRSSSSSRTELITPPLERDPEEVDKAVAKIQAGVRGMQTRSELKRRMSESGKEYLEKEKAATKIQAGVRGMKARLEVKNRRQMTLDDSRRTIEPLEEEEEEEDGGGEEGGKCDEVETMASADDRRPDEKLAATKIQAGVRGMQTRRNIGNRTRSATLHDSNQGNSEESPFGCLDPDKAATKIQAGVRGMKMRSDLKKRLPDSEPEGATTQPAWKYGQSSVDVERAATKIQAGVRGMKTRKNLQTRKGMAPWKTFDEDVFDSFE